MQAPSRRPKEDSLTGERRRADLVEASFSLIAEKGLEGLRTRDVAARAGVNISTLHYYFETKEKLVSAVVEYVHDYFVAVRREVRSGPAATADIILGRMLGADHRQRVTARPELYAVLHELFLRARRGGATAAVMREMHTRWDADVAALLQQGITEGVFRSDIVPEDAAPLLSAFIVGATVKLGLKQASFDMVATTKLLEMLLAPAGSRR